MGTKSKVLIVHPRLGLISTVLVLEGYSLHRFTPLMVLDQMTYHSNRPVMYFIK